jgi:hypothetical protein
MATPSTPDPTTLLITSLIPLLVGISHNQGDQAVTLAALPNPEIPHQMMAPHPAMSPMEIPLPGEELHACLITFKASKGIDLLHIESSLVDLDLTPDILGNMSVSRLCIVTGAIEGHIWKFQVFATDWSAQLEVERQAIARSSSSILCATAAK